MESGQRRKKERRNGVGGEETRTEGGGRMDGEGTEEPTKEMETPSKARRQKEDNSNMGGKGCEAWIPVFGAASAMDYVALANLAVTSHEMKKVCEDEILMRKECELGHAENPSFFQTRVEKAHQKIRYPEGIGEYGTIRSGIWYDNLIGFDFGSRPADTTEFIEGAQYTAADNDRVALSRTITATRCLKCGYLYAMSVTGGKVRAMKHKMMRAVQQNFHHDDGNVRQTARMTRANRREAVLRKYEAIMEGIAAHPQE